MFKLFNIPGRALPAAQPQTEFTTTKVVSLLLDIAETTSSADFNSVKAFFINELNKDPEIMIAFDNANINAVNLPSEFKEMFIKGFNQKLAGDIQVVYRPGYFFGGATGTTHGSMYPYDSHIPLLWMGWGVKHGFLNREVYMTDIAATLAAMLKIQMPSGNVGKVISEVIK